MRDRSDADWEELARKEPYFAVLTEERFLSAGWSAERQREFFASGEDDIQHLFDLVSAFLGVPPAPNSALDFGCGAGRLTLALSRRAKQVVGVDAAPTMLQLARQHIAAAGTDNVVLVANLEELEGQHFDFICSLIVFQHIPVERGERLFRTLLGLLEPDGVIAVEFAFERGGGLLRRLARRLRASSPLLHHAVQVLRRERRLPYMQMNSYNRDRILALIAEAGCSAPVLIPTDHGGIAGAIVITEKRPAG